MEITGKIKKIDETKTVGASGFKIREMVVTTDEQYPQMLLVQFVQDKCDLLNNYKVGQDVKVAINLRGREWINPQGEAVYFNTIQGWRVEPFNEGAAAGSVPAMTPDDFKTTTEVDDSEPDDLPF
ncbi:MAG: DUF3127 domain-containing protein [Lutibacter sp.]|nr:DUF3127 domain-containing protein [Lutibacter sp.]MBP9600636.1 DUF3127 domain-containing protein [Lutibacter sp.]